MRCPARFVCLLAAVSLSLASNAQKKPSRWVGSWATAPVGVGNTGSFPRQDATLRQRVHLSLGGSAIRIRLSNEFGVEPLTIGAGAVSVATGGGIDAASTKAVTFGGAAKIVIPPGAFVLSDRIALAPAALSDLAIDLYVPSQPMKQITMHGGALEGNGMGAGNQVGARTLNGVTEFTRWFFLKGVDVETGPASAAIVAFGDSITDGDHSTKDANRRWPDVLAARLQADPRTKHLAVLNEGISGNRLQRDLGGVSALARFDRDVLGQAGVKYLVILEGINDIGHVNRPAFPGDTVTAPELTFVLQQLIDRAHAHGIMVMGATLTPYPGGGDAAADIVRLQHEENDWILHSGKFDGVVDLARATADPANPTTMLPAYDSGDHLHPGDAGYKAMGNAIDLSFFTK